MRPADVIRRGGDYLDRHGVESPLPTAESLLAGILGTNRAALYARSEGLSTAEAKAFGRALCRRCTGTPLQHLTREQGFRHLILAVGPGVFIPRPETETLVEVGLSTIVDLASPVVVDVGTGSGAVALAVADEHPGATVWATDLSPEAVSLASANAQRVGVVVQVLQGDLMAPLPARLRGGIDLAISNPPYLSRALEATLPHEVRADPPLALYGSIEIYRRIAAEASDWLHPGGSLAVEVDGTNAAAVEAALRDRGFESVTTAQDLTGRDRVVSARQPAAATRP